MDKYAPFIGLIIILPVIVLISWAVLSVRKKYLDWFYGRIDKLLILYDAISEQRDGYFNVVFPAYAGYLFSASEVEIDTFAPKENAMPLINQIALNNISLGLLTPLFPYILFLTIVNWISNIIRLKHFFKENRNSALIPR